MKKTKNFRISDHTERQLDALAKFMGTTDTEVFSLAIDRLYQSNIIMSNADNLQVRWQNWRNWFYNEMIHETHRTEQAQRYIGGLDKELPSYDHHAGNLASDQHDIQSAQDLYYEQISPLDARIKKARRENNYDELIGALAEAERMIEIMHGYFIGSAAPD